MSSPYAEIEECIELARLNAVLFFYRCPHLPVPDKYDYWQNDHAYYSVSLSNIDAIAEEFRADLRNGFAKMSLHQIEGIIYGDEASRDSDRRHLANWYEAHQRQIAERERIVNEGKRREKLKEEALAKLTEEEKGALGLATS